MSPERPLDASLEALLRRLDALTARLDTMALRLEVLEGRLTDKAPVLSTQPAISEEPQMFWVAEYVPADASYIMLTGPWAAYAAASRSKPLRGLVIIKRPSMLVCARADGKEWKIDKGAV